MEKWENCDDAEKRNDTIKRLDALLEYAVMHGDEAEAERICEELRKLTDEV